MGFSLSHILLVVVVALVVFGAGRLPQVMSDLAKGLRAFKDGLRDEGQQDDEPHVSASLSGTSSAKKS